MTAKEFWRHVDKSERKDFCWIWHGPGTVRLPDGTTALPHRLAYVMATGSVPVDRRVKHRCSSGIGYCVRPDHLCLGSEIAIKDEFTNRKLSGERKRQLRKIKRGLCVKCNSKLATKVFCKKHAVERRETQRRSQSAVWRYKTLTYRL